MKLPIYCTTEHFLEFEEWYELFEDFINMELAETGADREMCFNSEREFERRYEMYLNNMKEKEEICPKCSSTFMVHQSGCSICMECGYSSCDL